MSDKENIIDPLSGLDDNELDALITELGTVEAPDETVGGFLPEESGQPVDDITNGAVGAIQGAGPLGAAIAGGAELLNDAIGQDSLRGVATDVVFGGGGEAAGTRAGAALGAMLPPHLRALQAAAPLIGGSIGAIGGMEASDAIQGREPMSLEETALIGLTPPAFRAAGPLLRAPVKIGTHMAGASIAVPGRVSRFIGEGLENWSSVLRDKPGKFAEKVKDIVRSKLEGPGRLGRALGADSDIMSRQHEWYKDPTAAGDFGSVEKRVLESGFFDNTAVFQNSKGLLDDLSQGKLTPERIAVKASKVLDGDEATGTVGLGDILKGTVREISNSAKEAGMKLQLSESGFNDILALARGRRSLYKTARAKGSVTPKFINEIHEIKKSKLNDRMGERYDSLNRVLKTYEGQLDGIDDQLSRLGVKEGVKSSQQGFKTVSPQTRSTLKDLQGQRQSVLEQRDEVVKQLKEVDSLIDTEGFSIDEVHDMLKAYSEDSEFIKSIVDQDGGSRIASEISQKMRNSLHEAIKAYSPDAYSQFSSVNRTYGDLKVLQAAAWKADKMLLGQLDERAGLTFGLMPKLVRTTAASVARRPVGTLRAWRVGEMIGGNIERKGISGEVANLFDNVEPLRQMFAPIGRVAGAGLRFAGQRGIHAGSMIRDVGKQIDNWALTQEFLPEALRHGIVLSMARESFGQDVTDVPEEDAVGFSQTADKIASGIERDYFEAVRTGDYEQAAIILGNADKLAPGLLQPGTSGAVTEYKLDGKTFIADDMERRKYADKVVKSPEIPPIPKAKMLKALFHTGEVLSKASGHSAPVLVSGGR